MAGETPAYDLNKCIAAAPPSQRRGAAFLGHRLCLWSTNYQHNKK